MSCTEFVVCMPDARQLCQCKGKLRIRGRPKEIKRSLQEASQTLAMCKPLSRHHIRLTISNLHLQVQQF